MDTVIKNGGMAPGFELNDLSGQPHSLEKYRGKVVVLNFWSAECIWTQRADEIMLPMLEEWGDEVVLLSIASNANEELEDLVKVKREHGIPLVLHDARQEVAKRYSAITTPHVFVIDQEGVLRYQGAFDDVTFRQPEPTRNYLFEAVERVLAGERPEPAEMPSYGCTVVYHQI